MRKFKLIDHSLKDTKLPLCDWMDQCPSIDGKTLWCCDCLDMSYKYLTRKEAEDILNKWVESE